MDSIEINNKNCYEEQICEDTQRRDPACLISIFSLKNLIGMFANLFFLKHEYVPKTA